MRKKIRRGGLALQIGCARWTEQRDYAGEGIGVDPEENAARHVEGREEVQENIAEHVGVEHIEDHVEDEVDEGLPR